MSVNQVYIDNTAVLANAVKLSTEIIMEVAGNHASNRIDGETITEEQVAGMSAAIIQRELKKGTQ